MISPTKDFRIKVSGQSGDQKVHKLVGMTGLLSLVEATIAENLIRRAYESTGDKCECRLRRGLKIVFYAK
jgi:hypothetical protein